MINIHVRFINKFNSGNLFFLVFNINLEEAESSFIAVRIW
jgi:hypothetical protein